MGNIFFRTGEKIIRTDDIMFHCKQTLTQVRTDETRTAGNKNSFLVYHDFLSLASL